MASPLPPTDETVPLVMVLLAVGPSDWHMAEIVPFVMKAAAHLAAAGQGRVVDAIPAVMALACSRHRRRKNHNFQRDHLATDLLGRRADIAVLVQVVQRGLHDLQVAGCWTSKSPTVTSLSAVWMVTLSAVTLATVPLRPALALPPWQRQKGRGDGHDGQVAKESLHREPSRLLLAVLQPDRRTTPREYSRFCCKLPGRTCDPHGHNGLDTGEVTVHKETYVII